MTFEIISALVSIAVTTASFGYMCCKWNSVSKNGADVINHYDNNTENFFQTFLSLYPHLPQAQKKNFPKFILYYLAQKGYLTLKIEDNGNIKVLHTGEAGEANPAEQHLLNSIFQNSEEYFLSEDAIVGIESVNLNEINQQYTQGMQTCPLGYKIGKKHEATLSNPGHNVIFDSDRMSSDFRRAQVISLIISLPIPACLGLDTNNYNVYSSLFDSYLSYVLLVVPTFFALNSIKRSEKRKPMFGGAHPELSGKMEILRITVDVMILISEVLILFVVLILPFQYASGISIFSTMYGIAAIIATWLLIKKKRANKAMTYLTAENDLYEFISYMKTKFKSVRQKSRKIRAGFNDSLNSSAELLPFASLLGKKKDIDALLLEEKSKLPNWLNAEKEMTFEQADILIDSCLSNVQETSK